MDSQSQPDLAKIEELILESDTGGRKRMTISNEFVDIIQSVVEKLQEQKGSPASFPAIIDHIRENKLFGEGVAVSNSSCKGPAYVTNRFFTTPCLNYWSMDKWNDEYETYLSRF